MRKVEEEAVRRARALIFAAQNDHKEKTEDPLSNIFGNFEPQSDVAMADLINVEDDDSDIEMGEIIDD